MKSLFLKIFLSFWAAQALAGVSVAAPKQVKPPFSIVISTETPTIKAASGLSIMVHITNISNHDVNATSEYFEGPYGFIDAGYDEEVRDSKGNLARNKQPPGLETEYGVVSASARLKTLKPGESGGSVTGVSPQYDISQPGEYVIQLSKRISDNP
ncbi:MAG: hypothetical protein ABSB87_19045 [Terriglobales bacterium]|jgi:hypothetical protein